MGMQHRSGMVYECDQCGKIVETTQARPGVSDSDIGAESWLQLLVHNKPAVWLCSWPCLDAYSAAVAAELNAVEPATPLEE